MAQFINTLNPEHVKLLKGYRDEAHREFQQIKDSQAAVKDIVFALLEALGVDAEDKEAYKEAKKEITAYFKLTFTDKVKELLSLAEAVEVMDSAANEEGGPF